MEVKPGVCPFFSTKVGINIASHVITQHENILKALCLKKHRYARSRSTILLLRKDLQEKHLRCIQVSPCVDTSSDAAADPTLLSFLNNPHHTYRSKSNEAASVEASLSVENSNDNSSERILSCQQIGKMRGPGGPIFYRD